jgi:predicted extracellular nuclease
VQQSAGAGGSSPLPAPDASGSIAMAATSGKVALRSTAAPLTGACAAGADIADLVGYGVTTCFEGTAATAQPSNTTGALRKRGGCVDSNDNAADFSIGTPSPRNSAVTRTCGFTTLPIHAIQGAGALTPVAGVDVTTTGIVTARKSNGFFLQTPDGSSDSDPATSQAVFVFTGGAPAVLPGDAVTVRGTATEFFNLTQLESSLAGDVTVDSTGNPLPSPVTLTTAILNAGGAPTELERFEGMRVHANALVSVAPTNEFGETYTVLSGVPRPMREPGIEIALPVPPDPNGDADCCIPRWDMNPERLLVDSDGLAGSTPLSVTSNTMFSNVTGPLDFTFSEYKVLPETPPVTAGGMGAVAVPEAAANEFTVAGFNIENFTSAKASQLRKAALAIRTVMRSPDVIGVIEIADLVSLQALAAQVNSDAGAAGEPDPAYEAHLVQAPAGGSQNVGYLVKTSRVAVESVTQELGTVPFGTALLHDRPPLVLRATVDPFGSNPGRIIVLVNHLRSFIDIELSDAEGARVRGKRTAQAESIAELLQDLQTANPGTPIISVGDYNAYQFNDGYTDPISVLKGTPTPGDQLVVGTSPDLVSPDFSNLTDVLPAAERYSFIFEGTPQALDHVLVNQVAESLRQRYAIARSNADFPEVAALTGDTARPERNSDHDMPVAYFAFPGTPVVTLNGAAVMHAEAYVPFVDPGATAHNDAGPLPVTTTGTVDVSVPGTYTLTYTASSGFWETSVTRTVIVADTTAPAITGFTLSRTTLGPPNHSMVDLSARYTVADASGIATCSIGVASNEPANGAGDGNTAIDWEVLDAHRLRLRAERAGGNGGRIYTVTLTCADAAGNTSSGAATAVVGK